MIIAFIIAMILGIASLFLLIIGSRNEYDDLQSDEDQVKYLNEWCKTHNKR
jgi:hypothetical protein